MSTRSRTTTLEYPGGETILVTNLAKGSATVLQLPSPRSLHRDAA